jgi:hypothetical protein
MAGFYLAAGFSDLWLRTSDFWVTPGAIGGVTAPLGASDGICTKA